MYSTLYIVSAALAGFIIFRTLSFAFERIKHAAAASAVGAEDAPLYPNSGFLGLQHIKEMLAADKAKQYTRYTLTRHEIMTKTTGQPFCATFRVNKFGHSEYHTGDPRLLRYILVEQPQDFEYGPLRQRIFFPTMGEGIFSQDGKRWEHSRAMIRPTFARAQVSDLDMVERHIQALLGAMPAAQSDGWTSEFDLQTLFHRLTLDTATEFLFGESVHSQTSDEDPKESFGENWDSALGHVLTRYRLSQLYWLHNPREYKENNQVIDKLVSHFVDKALKRHEAGEKHADKYVLSDALAEKTQEPREIFGQLTNVLFAGRDTTAGLLSYVFQELLHNPEFYDRLRSVVIDTFGTYEQPHDITFAELKGCRYLQAVISETLRLCPVVPVTVRTTAKPTTLPHGGGRDGTAPIHLPRGVEIYFYQHVIHHRKDIWGEDVEEFRPERFVGRRNGWEFMPFSGGPRICIGQQMALIEASYTLVRLLQKFDAIEPADGYLEAERTDGLRLTNSPGKRVRLRMHTAAA